MALQRHERPSTNWSRGPSSVAQAVQRLTNFRTNSSFGGGGSVFVSPGSLGLRRKFPSSRIRRRHLLPLSGVASLGSSVRSPLQFRSLSYAGVNSGLDVRRGKRAPQTSQE